MYFICLLQFNDLFECLCGHCDLTSRMSLSDQPGLANDVLIFIASAVRNNVPEEIDTSLHFRTVMISDSSSAYAMALNKQR